MGNSLQAVSPIVAVFGSSQSIRIVMIDNEPWFVASDVCAAIGIQNSRDSVSRLDDDEKGVALTDTLGGKQESAIINESGLYTLILRCRDAVKPGAVAHKFRKWVTGEVLPAIRKTGRYEMPDAPKAKPVYLAELGVKLTQHFIERMGRYYYRSGQCVSKLVHGAVRARYNVKNVRDVPYAMLDDVIQFLEYLTDEAFRIWSVCNELENWQLSRLFGVKVGDCSGLSEEFAGHLPSMLYRVDMPVPAMREISSKEVNKLVAQYSHC